MALLNKKENIESNIKKLEKELDEMRKTERDLLDKKILPYILCRENSEYIRVSKSEEDGKIHLYFNFSKTITKEEYYEMMED